MGLVLAVWVLSACMPTISRTLAWAQRGTLIEICTAAGPVERVVQGDTQTALASKETPAPDMVLDHCGFCLLAADRGLAPMPALPLFLLQALRLPLGPFLPVWVGASRVAHAPPPRGPPASL